MSVAEYELTGGKVTAQERATNRPATALLAAVLAATLAACAQPRDAEAPSKERDRPPAGPPQGGADHYGQPSFEQPAPPSPDPDQPPPPPAKKELETVQDATGALDDDQRLLDQLLGQPAVATGANASTCRRVCAAIASMRRAVEALCELTGEDDERCLRARRQLSHNERRAADAGCSC